MNTVENAYWKKNIFMLNMAYMILMKTSWEDCVVCILHLFEYFFYLGERNANVILISFPEIIIMNIKKWPPLHFCWKHLWNRILLVWSKHDLLDLLRNSISLIEFRFYLFINFTSLKDVVLFIYQFHQLEGCSSFYLSISSVWRMQFFLVINFTSWKDAVLFIYQLHQFEWCGSFYWSISPVWMMQLFLFIYFTSLKDAVLFIYKFHQFEWCGSFYWSVSPVWRMWFFLFINFTNLKHVFYAISDAYLILVHI